MKMILIEIIKILQVESVKHWLLFLTQQNLRYFFGHQRKFSLYAAADWLSQHDQSQYSCPNFAGHPQAELSAMKLSYFQIQRKYSDKVSKVLIFEYI